MLDPSVGWGLIALAIILFVVEIMLPGQTFLMVPGTFFATLGVIALATGSESFTFSWGLIIALAMTIISAVLTFTIYKKLGKIQKPQTTVAESLIGRKGKVTKRIVPDEISGKVRIGSEVWSAKSDEPIEEGRYVEVVDSKGVHVVVVEVESPHHHAKKVEEAEEEAPGTFEPERPARKSYP
jgi:membrane-bound ClpP family serine protease